MTRTSEPLKMAVSPPQASISACEKLCESADAEVIVSTSSARAALSTIRSCSHAAPGIAMVCSSPTSWLKSADIASGASSAGTIARGTGAG